MTLHKSLGILFSIINDGDELWLSEVSDGFELNLESCQTNQYVSTKLTFEQLVDLRKMINAVIIQKRFNLKDHGKLPF